MEKLSQHQANRIVAQLERDRFIVVDIPLKERPPASFALTLAEREFFFLAKEKRGRVFRAGWPDFLVELPDKTIGVEVKRDRDTISKAQNRTFAALERLKIPVFVWNPRRSKVLTPWRKYRPIP